MLNEAGNKTKEENYRVSVILERLNHLKPLRADFHDATLVRDLLCHLQKDRYLWVADGNSLKNGSSKSQRAESCRYSSSPAGD